ncbi:hypothetical protein [Actinoplanes xinjiangensis]|uniref:hypothetical protein n=1 Tax=Actinoplanes xinjiangensis TaxID=512350 RepID=UPI0034138546
MTENTRSLLLAAVATVTLAVAGCGGADEPATTADGGGGSYPAEDVCAFLEGQIPALKAIGGPVGRHANLAGGLATFFASHGKPENGAVLDAAVTAQCPSVRTEVLTLIDVESFSSF